MRPDYADAAQSARRGQKSNNIEGAGKCRWSKREESRHDPTLLGTQYAPGASRRAAVHRLDANAHIFQFANEGARWLAQARSGAEQQEFGQRIDGQQVTQRSQRELPRLRRVAPPQGARRGEQQPFRKDIVPDAKASAGKAGNDRPLPRLVTAQFDTGALVGQGRAPSSRGPMRSAWAAIFVLLAFFSPTCGDRPSVMRSEEDT